MDDFFSEASENIVTRPLARLGPARGVGRAPPIPRAVVPMSVCVPTIDFGAFEGRDPEAHARVVRQVADACERVGFFFASNHGIEERVLSDALRHARGFFEQPLEAKMRVADLKKGYIPVGGCDNAVRPSSMHEKFSCGPVDVDENDEYYVGADARAALYFGERNRWPSTPSGFRDAYESYYRAVVGFVDVLHRAFAEALGAPPTFFSRSSRKHVSNLVALRYPPVQEEASRVEIVSKSPLERVRPHTDPTDVTVLLFEDGPRGLQVMPEGGASANEWIDVPDDAADRDDETERMKKKLLVNLGDATQFWTNDRWRSTRHRVIVRDVEEAKRDRVSLVFFHAPDYDARVDAAALAAAQMAEEDSEKVVSATRPARYAPFEYSERTHFAQLARDERGLRDRQVLDPRGERAGLTER
jgi:isopenicillin N synthase-like dioxygenase